jgi:hypothetical protein
MSRWAGWIGIAVLVAGCESDPSKPVPTLTGPSVSGSRGSAPSAPDDRLAGAIPNFGLVDANTASPTHGAIVTPRQFVGSISAYYFGSAL